MEVFIKSPPKVDDVRTFQLSFRNQCSNVVKHLQEEYLWHEERPKFENLEVFYNSDPAYNLTRVRVCQEYDQIFETLRIQLHNCIRESESLGDTLRIDLCNEALEVISTIEGEVKHELEYVYQQRSLNEINMDEMDQSEKEFQQSSEKCVLKAANHIAVSANYG